VGCNVNRDLAEVRRFWPKAGSWYLFGEVYVPKPIKQHMLSAMQSSDGSWYVTRYEDGCARSTHFVGPTIAAAMAAAGFGVRPIVGYRSCRLTVDRLKKDLGTGSLVKLESRQRPRKGVRFGKLGRQLPW